MTNDERWQAVHERMAGVMLTWMEQDPDTAMDLVVEICKEYGMGYPLMAVLNYVGYLLPRESEKAASKLRECADHFWKIHAV